MAGELWRLTTNLRGAVAYTPPGADRPTRFNAADATVHALGFGWGTGRASVLVDTTAAIDAGGSLTIDLFGGGTGSGAEALADVSGRPAAFARLKGMAAWVEDGGDSSGVTVAPAASNGNTLWFGGTTPSKTIYPDGPPELGGDPSDGKAVDASACRVTLTNNGAAAVVVRLAFGGVGPMGATFFPGANLQNLLG